MRENERSVMRYGNLSRYFWMNLPMRKVQVNTIPLIAKEPHVSKQYSHFDVTNTVRNR